MSSPTPGGRAEELRRQHEAGTRVKYRDPRDGDYRFGVVEGFGPHPLKKLDVYTIRTSGGNKVRVAPAAIIETAPLTGDIAHA